MPEIAGVEITNAARIYPETGIGKLELASYYARVGARMLPHVKDRPLTLLLWDERRGAAFMRHAKAWGPKVLRRVRVREKTKIGEYLVVDDVAGLVALAQMNVLEIHPWNAVSADVECPDRIVFDLDPAPDVAWTRVVAAATEIRGRLRALGLESFPKTTGGKGLHVVVPLARTTWKECFEFSRAFAEVMVRLAPDRYVATMSTARRTGKIFVDYLRNNRTSTSVAAFSARARPGAPISMPVSWARLATVENADFTVRTALPKRDPWPGFFTLRQRLPQT